MQVPKPVSRREFMRLSGLAVGATGLALSTMGRAADLPTGGRDADTVLAQLLEGNKRFMKGILPTLAGNRRISCHWRRVRLHLPRSSAVRTHALPLN